MSVFFGAIAVVWMIWLAIICITMVLGLYPTNRNNYGEIEELYCDEGRFGDEQTSEEEGEEEINGEFEGGQQENIALRVREDTGAEGGSDGDVNNLNGEHSAMVHFDGEQNVRQEVESEGAHNMDGYGDDDYSRNDEYDDEDDHDYDYNYDDDSVNDYDVSGSGCAGASGGRGSSDVMPDNDVINDTTEGSSKNVNHGNADAKNSSECVHLGYQLDELPTHDV